MIGVGDALGSVIELILFLSLFTFIIIPTICLFGLKKTQLISRINNPKKILILTVLYLITAFTSHFIMISFLQFGFTFSIILTGTMLFLALGFNLIMLKRTEYKKL